MSRGTFIRFVWIRAHVGIVGNEWTDFIAKKATVNVDVLDIKLPYRDIFPHIKKECLAKWQANYSAGEKGRFYKSLQPLIRKKTMSTNNFVEHCVV